MRAAILLSMALSACVIVDGKPDSPAEDVSSFPTCVVPEDATPETSTWDDASELELELHGTIVDLGSGLPGNGCLDANGWLGGRAADASDAWWVLVDDGELGRYTVASTTLGAVPSLEVGQEVHVTWTWQANSPFAGYYGDNELKIGDWEEAPVAWVGNGGSLASLHPPYELSLTLGDELYRVATECYTEVGYALNATVDGNTASLDFGETASLSRYRIAHGGTTVGEDLSCSETSGDQTHVALIH